MGLGAHHETLNGQWGGLNLQRILTFHKFICLNELILMLQMILGQEFLCHLKEALEMHKKHQQLFGRFTATFQPSTIISWEKLINAWKKGWSQPNPYFEPSPCKLIIFNMVLNLIGNGYQQ